MEKSASVFCWEERLHGIQEAVGSIFPSSTNDYKGLEGFPPKPFFVEYTKKYTSERRVDIRWKGAHEIRSLLWTVEKSTG